RDRRSKVSSAVPPARRSSSSGSCPLSRIRPGRLSTPLREEPENTPSVVVKFTPPHEMSCLTKGKVKGRRLPRKSLNRERGVFPTVREKTLRGLAGSPEFSRFFGHFERN